MITVNPNRWPCEIVDGDRDYGGQRAERAEEGFSEGRLSEGQAPAAFFRKLTSFSHLTRQCLPIFGHGMRPSLHWW